MKIQKSTPTIDVAIVPIGEVFEHNGSYYMRIQPRGTNYNAIALETAQLWNFTNIKVTPIEGKFVIKEKGEII